jgi:hypothetical protein
MPSIENLPLVIVTQWYENDSNSTRFCLIDLWDCLDRDPG